ncbi:MAG: MmcQ/YjbR family DNA-binding protein [Luteimonas sp.]
MQIEQLRSYALSLPETSEEPHFHYSSYRVRGKIFATVPPDGGFVHIFVGDEQRDMALALYPEVVESLAWGKKIVGVRVALANVKAAFVQELLRGAWDRKAPKSLAGRARPRT